MTVKILTFGSLFAGIGGLDLGLERAGMTCVWQVEIDDYATKVLEKHWPDIARFRDVRDCGKHNLESVDLICGGFPCQDVSLAGKREGLKGKRTMLWDEFARIICEIRPRWVLAENVPGLLSSDDGRFFGKVLRDLAQSGYDAEWQTIPASALGAYHRRKRIFIVAYSKSASKKRFLESGRGKGSQREPGGFLGNSGRLESFKWRNEPKARMVRVADGIPDRVDRLRCLGNAVVPQVAEWIGRQIIAAET